MRAVDATSTQEATASPSHSTHSRRLWTVAGGGPRLSTVAGNNRHRPGALVIMAGCHRVSIVCPATWNGCSPRDAGFSACRQRRMPASTGDGSRVSSGADCWSVSRMERTRRSKRTRPCRRGRRSRCVPGPSPRRAVLLRTRPGGRPSRSTSCPLSVRHLICRRSRSRRERLRRVTSRSVRYGPSYFRPTTASRWTDALSCRWLGPSSMSVGRLRVTRR